MNKQLRAYIEKTIGKIHQVNLLNEQGCTSKVCQLISDRGVFLLKSSFKDKYREWLKAEADVLEKRKHVQISIPIFYGFFEDEDSSHLIMSYEDGVTLTAALKNAESIDEKKSLFKSFGAFLHKLHEAVNPAILNLKGNWLEEQLIKAEEYLKMGEADGNAELLEKIKLNKPLPIRQTIIHGDCTTDNVLVVNGEVHTFIDVAGMTVGDPRYDVSLAIRKIVKNEELLGAFYEGYRRLRVSKDEFHYFEDGLYAFF